MCMRGTEVGTRTHLDKRPCGCTSLTQVAAGGMLVSSGRRREVPSRGRGRRRSGAGAASAQGGRGSDTCRCGTCSGE